jgi:rhamnosyltransferase subunit B
MRRVILVSIGTDGDVYPFLAIGIELRRRGYPVTLASHEHFESRAREAELEFQPLVSNEETKQLWQQRDFWHPLKSPLVAARWGSRLLRKHYEVLKSLASQDKTVLVANPGVVAARLVQEKIRTPLISVLLQPWLIPSLHAPAVMMGGLTLPRWAPRPAGKVYFRLFNLIGARLMGAEFKQLRDSLGLRPMRNMFQWWLSPQLALGLFPDWFGPPQPDWPPQIQLVGFPKNSSPNDRLSEDLASFCKQDRRVFAFTFGTGMMHATSLFEQAVEACLVLGARAVFLTTFRSQLPAQLPSFVHACDFAPFQNLFPLCAAVVHHGGIGTVASALRAGTPQLILPFAFDQMDNAVRVKRLGVGTWLKPSRRNSQEISSALNLLLNADIVAKARNLAERLQDSDGIECAANCIELYTQEATIQPGGAVV